VLSLFLFLSYMPSFIALWYRRMCSLGLCTVALWTSRCVDLRLCTVALLNESMCWFGALYSCVMNGSVNNLPEGNGCKQQFPYPHTQFAVMNAPAAHAPLLRGEIQ
jgi:hypothetical protein